MSKTFNKNIQYTFNPQITLPTSSGLTITGNSNTIGSIFTTGGNVGIGTTAPSTKLHLRDNGSVTLLIEADADNVTETDVPTIKIRQDGGAQGMDIGLDSGNQVYIDFGAGTLNANIFNIMHKSVPLLQITTSGNVGIGTTTDPSYSLQVDGNVALNVMPGIGTTGSIKIGRQDFDARWHMINVNTGTSATLSNMIFSLHNAVTSTTIAPVLTLRGDGHVGIGTTAPSSKLDVIGTIRGNTYTGGNIAISGSIGSLGSIDAGTQFLGQPNDSATGPSYSWTGDTNTGMYRPLTDQLGFVTNGVERIRVSSAGNVGIGTTSPQSAFHVITQITSVTVGNGVHLSMDTNNNANIQLNAGANSTSGTAYIDFGYGGVDYVSRIIHNNRTKNLDFQVNQSTQVM